MPRVKALSISAPSALSGPAMSIVPRLLTNASSSGLLWMIAPVTGSDRRLLILSLISPCTVFPVFFRASEASSERRDRFRLLYWYVPTMEISGNQAAIAAFLSYDAISFFFSAACSVLLVLTAISLHCSRVSICCASAAVSCNMAAHMIAAMHTVLMSFLFILYGVLFVFDACFLVRQPPDIAKWLPVFL